MTFEKMVEQVTDIANGTFAKVETKEKIRNHLLDLIALACHQCENDETFKRDIKKYLNWRRLNITVEKARKT